MANIKIYGVLVNDTTEGIVARADQILDPNLGKTQDNINKEVLEIIEDFKDPTITYDDYVTPDSNNAVKSKGIFQFVDEATSHMPYIGDDGFVYTWDLALGDYVRTGTNLTGPAGETGGTVHLIFDTTLIKINNLGQMYPGGPFRVRVIKQYGETGLDAYRDGCVKWWYNGIENENEPDGWIGWEDENNPDRAERNDVNSGTDMSEFTININPDQTDIITFVLYIDKKGTKTFDQQNIFVIRDPAIYKLDLTNETSMVPMCDDEGKVDDGYFEPSQAILYHGAEMIEPVTIDKDGNEIPNINFSIVSHDGLLNAEIDNRGIITVSGWRKEWSVVNVKVCANYEGNNFYATYTITRVAGMTIYRLHPSSTAIKREKDGTYSTEFLYANVFKVQASNSGGVNSKISSYASEGLKVCYTYNNKIVNVEKDIYYLDNTEEGIPIYGESLPETLDGEVREVDIYLLRASQEVSKKEHLEVFIDHETVPVVENGDDGFNLYLSNDSCTVNCKANGEQEGYIWDTQALFMRGIEDFSNQCKWSCSMEPFDGLSSLPQHVVSTPGYFSLAGRTMKDNIDQVSVIIKAQYPAINGDEYSKIYTITKAKQGQIGESGYKSTVFLRTNNRPDRPLSDRSGGTYENPVPTHYATSGNVIITDAKGKKLKWSDGIPTDSEAMIWASSRLFTTTGEQNTEWSDPALMADTSTFNVEFTYFDPCKGDPDTEPDFWFDPVEDAKVFREKPMVYMATQSISNGEPVMHEDENGNLTSWVIVRVLGERGDATFKSMVFTRSELCPPIPQGGDYDNPIPDPELSEGVVWSDGIPGGDPLHAIWMSQRSFSTLSGFESEWSTPTIIKDVPGQYDVEYSLMHDNPGNPTDNPDNWIDPGSGGLTPEQQEQIWWLAQRWHGIEWSEDGVNPGWSPWDVMKIRGENGKDGKDGSKAIPRMRGAWEDLGIGDWILSGTSHTDDSTGNTMQEEYQDLVYRTQDKKEVCYKCLISHKKSNDHDPALLEYEQDPNTGGHKSKDGYWLKAEQFEFISTKLLNAEQIIAKILSTEKLIVPGSWDGKDGSIETQVVTENGKIEFNYKNAEGNWITLVDIGLDPNPSASVKYGVLRFYNLSGQAMYDLGPNGLSASEVDSPSVSEHLYWVRSDGKNSPVYNCWGVLFDKVAEKNNFYNSETGTIKIPLSTKKDDLARYVRTYSAYATSSGIGWKNGTIDKGMYYYKLLLGSFIPQMTIRFFIYESISHDGEYDLYDPNPDSPDDSVWYESGDKKIIQFGKNTVGYFGKKYPNIMYQYAKFPWISGGESGEGMLTYPVRKWDCIYDPLTSLVEFTVIEGDVHNENEGTLLSIDVYISGAPSPFRARLYSTDKDTNEGGSNSIRAANYSITLAKTGTNSNLFNILANGSYSYDNLLLNEYFTITEESSDVAMVEGFDHATNCLDIIKEAVCIVMDTINALVDEGHTNFTQQGPLNIFNPGDFTSVSGIQVAFKSIIDRGCDHRMTPIIAKNILNELFSYYVAGDSDLLIGYIFPENQYFDIIKEGDYDYYLDLVSVPEEEELYKETKGLINLIGQAKNTTQEAIGYYYSLPYENKENARAFLVIDSLSSNMGSIDLQTEGAIGNVYEIYMKRVTVEGETNENAGEGETWNESKFIISYKAVPKFGAFLKKGIYTMPDSYGQNLTYGNNDPWSKNAFFERINRGYTFTSNV